jgi:ssDNA-binding Zn-finger/Zn-ribbon topoisomerase 1
MKNNRHRRAARIPAPVLYGVLAVAVIGIAVSIYIGRDTSASAGGAIGSTEGMAYRKCISCSATDEIKREELVAKGWVDIEGVRLMGEGAKCPKCGKDTMAMAQKCPKDGTIFVPDPIQTMEGKGGCPKCNWLPGVGSTP